jgi:hypothetical protein
MKVLVSLCFLVLLTAVALFAAQDAKTPASQPVANQPQIPQPDPITLDSLKVTMADAVLSRDNCNAYAGKLQAKIVELSGEVQKLKDELAKAKPATAETSPTPEPKK